MNKAKLGGMASVLASRPAIQRCLKKLEEWLNRNLGSSAKSNVKSCSSYTEHPLASVQVGNRLPTDSFAEQELRVLVNDNLKFSQQSGLVAIKANCMLGRTSKNVQTG